MVIACSAHFQSEKTFPTACIIMSAEYPFMLELHNRHILLSLAVETSKKQIDRLGTKQEHISPAPARVTSVYVLGQGGNVDEFNVQTSA